MILTNTLLDRWGVDQDMIAELAHANLGPCDVFIGGSLADDLGTADSDIDLYCFSSSSAAEHHRMVVPVAEDGQLDLHVVNVDRMNASTESLVPLVTAHPLPEAHWPSLSAWSVRILHALYRDRSLSATAGVTEELRARMGADALPLYVAARAGRLALVRRDQARAAAATGAHDSALEFAGLALDAALDAALAALGQVSPNPKFRWELARRAGLDRYAPGGLDAPSTPDADPAGRLALLFESWDAFMEFVRQDHFLARLVGAT